MSKSITAFAYPLNGYNAGNSALIEGNMIIKQVGIIQSSHIGVLNIERINIGDNVAGMVTGVVECGNGQRIVISDMNTYIGIFNTLEAAENCYATSQTIEAAMSRLMK